VLQLVATDYDNQERSVPNNFRVTPGLLPTLKIARFTRQSGDFVAMRSSRPFSKRNDSLGGRLVDVHRPVHHTGGKPGNGRPWPEAHVAVDSGAAAGGNGGGGQNGEIGGTS